MIYSYLPIFFSHLSMFTYQFCFSPLKNVFTRLAMVNHTHQFFIHRYQFFVHTYLQIDRVAGAFMNLLLSHPTSFGCYWVMHGLMHDVAHCYSQDDCYCVIVWLCARSSLSTMRIVSIVPHSALRAVQEKIGVSSRFPFPFPFLPPLIFVFMLSTLWGLPLSGARKVLWHVCQGNLFVLFYRALFSV